MTINIFSSTSITNCHYTLAYSDFIFTACNTAIVSRFDCENVKKAVPGRNIKLLTLLTYRKTLQMAATELS